MASTLPPKRSVGHLLAGLPDSAADEITAAIASVDGARIERIVSYGQNSPADFWYDQDDHEFVTVVSGAARLAWEDGSETELEPGGWAWIPAQTKHRISWTAPETATVWLAVFLPPAVG